MEAAIFTPFMKDSKQGNALAIFVKNQRLGAVKTRLAAAIGDQKALEVYAQLVHLTLGAAAHTAAAVHLFYHERLEPAPSNLIAQVHVQQGDSLGARMLHAFDLLLADYSKVILIGSDLPEIHSALIEVAFSRLDFCDVVLGPATDGGYYLLGLKHPQPQLFESMSYSHSEVFNQTLARAKTSHLEVSQLAVLRDLDTYDDLLHFGFLNDDSDDAR
ncbi:MAG: hypothetical protein RLZZ242_1461 [Bacteroidota bacterium]